MDCHVAALLAMTGCKAPQNDGNVVIASEAKQSIKNKDKYKNGIQN